MIFNYPRILKNIVNFDKRGYLTETYKKKNIVVNFDYSILVSSKKSVFRGLHFQIKKQQEKLLIVAKGSIIDYCIDLRKKSKTFSKIFTFNLKKNSILYIPKGFAHGYFCLEKINKLVYLLSNYRFKKYERVLDFKDPELKLNIRDKNIITSIRDKNGMSLDTFKKKIGTL